MEVLVVVHEEPNSWTPTLFSSFMGVMANTFPSAKAGTRIDK